MAQQTSNKQKDWQGVTNFDLDNIVTPVKVDRLEQLLKETHYDSHEIEFLVTGLRQGFDIGYEGPTNRKDTSKNIPFTKGVGSNQELWEKLIKEVEAV